MANPLNSRIRAGLALCGFTLGLLTGECLLRVTGYAPSAYDIQFGWVVRFDLDRLYRLQSGTRDDLNSDGYRSAEFSSLRPERPDVVLLGDSFTMGWNVPADQTVSAHLADRVGDRFDVVNLGVLSYGPDQSLVAYRAEKRKLQPAITVLNLFPGNDFEDIRKNRLLSITKSGALERTNAHIVRDAYPMLRLGFLLRIAMSGSPFPQGSEHTLFRPLFNDDPKPLDLSDERMRYSSAVMAEVLRSLRDESVVNGGVFFVSIIPSLCAVTSTDYCRRHGFSSVDSRNERHAIGLLEEKGVPYVDLTPRLTASHFSRDLHLTSDGYRIFADVLAEEIERLPFSKQGDPL